MNKEHVIAFRHFPPYPPAQDTQALRLPYTAKAPAAAVAGREAFLELKATLGAEATWAPAVSGFVLPSLPLTASWLCTPRLLV